MVTHRQVLDLFRIHQQQSRFVDSAYSSELNLVEMYVLIEIDINPHVTVRGLQPLLMLDHGTISRAYYHLIREEFVISHPDPNNRRKRILEVTGKGKRLLQLHDIEDDKFIKNHVGRLSSSEAAELQRCSNLIADATGIPRLTLRPSEHPHQEGMRRVTRGLGFSGPSFCGSGYSSTVWQLLAAIRDLAPKATLSILAEIFDMKASTLSQQISRFEADGWVQRSVGQDDSRVKTIILTDRGFSKLEEIYKHGERFLTKAFRHEPAQTVDNLVMILMKLFGVLGEQQVRASSVAVVCEPISSEEERKSARAYLILHLIRTGKYLDASETLISGNHENFVLRVGEKLKSVAELGKSEDGWELLNCGWDDQQHEESLLLQFLEGITLKLISSGKGSKVYVRRNQLPETVIEKMTRSTQLSKFLEVLA